jgi:predicted transcriptional regulator
MHSRRRGRKKRKYMVPRSRVGVCNVTREIFNRADREENERETKKGKSESASNGYAIGILSDQALRI